MKSIIEVWNRLPLGSGVILMENKGAGFNFMKIEGKVAQFSSEEKAKEWLLK